jgi:CRISPR-associated protein Cas2
MFIILVYDAGEKRVAKFLKTCRKYLTWVQCSVLEGELTGAQLERLKVDLRKVMDPEEDSIILYGFRTKAYFKREVIGLEKGSGLHPKIRTTPSVIIGRL